MWPPQYAPPPSASGDLQAFPEDFYIIYIGFSVAALRSLVTFDPLTCNWGHGSPMSWMGFLPANLQLAVPFHLLDLESGTGQTDRQTERDRQTAINALCHHSMGRGIAISILFVLDNFIQKSTEIKILVCYATNCGKAGNLYLPPNGMRMT